MGEYFSKIRQLVHDRRLTIRLIIAPPRTSSTLLESSLAASPNITHFCHEPFIDARYENFDPEIGYKKIFDSVDGNSFPGGTLLIKEMSHWLDTHNQCQRLIELAEGPILFIIRNPLLTMESRIKKVLQSTALKARSKTLQWLLEEYMQEGPPDDGVRRVLHDDNDLDTQQRLLDWFAEKRGFRNWDELLVQSFNQQRLNLFDELLQIDKKRFSTDSSGWSALERQTRFCEITGQEKIIIDSTEFRLAPEKTIQMLCELWEIQFDNKMLHWGERELDLSAQTRPQDLIWYDTLAKSRGVKPPTEIPPALTDFPPFIQKALIDCDIPTYVRLFANRIRITPEGLETDEARLIQNIDPMFTLLNYPSFQDTANSKYTDVFTIIKQELGNLENTVSENSYAARRK